MRQANPQRKAFDQAVLAYLDGLYGFAMSLTRNPTEAEDLVQDTYLKAALAEHKPEPGNNLKAWLFTIMRNLWLNRLRHRRSGPEFIDIESEEILEPYVSDPMADPQVVLLRQAEVDAVRTAIKRLAFPQREVLLLRDIEGFSYKEIADILACPAGTIMSRLARARERLKCLLRQTGTESALESVTDPACNYESL